MSLILVAKKSGKQVDLSKVVKNGKYTELAVPGEEYYVIDSETGKTPTDIEVSRSGDDLIIKSPSEDTTVVIDEFWHDCTPENQCYAIFDVPAVDGLEAGQVTVTQVGPDVSAFKPGMVGILPEGHSVSPWLWVGLGAALLGGLAAGGGGGGSGSSSKSDAGKKDNIEPPKDTTPPKTPTDLQVVDGSRVTGTTEPGAKVTIKDGNTVIGEGTADSNGHFDVPVSPSKTNGETLTAEASDAAGNTSAPGTVQAADTTKPAAPDNLHVSDDGKHVTGNAEPGTTVTIRDEKGDVIGSDIVKPDGTFDVTINTPKINEEPLTATATDKAGNTSDAAQVTAQDKTPPVIESAVITDAEGKTVEGQTEPGAKVVVKEGDKVIGEGQAGKDGKFTITLTEPKNNGEQLTVVATDDKQNNSTPFKMEPVDNTAPEGTVNISYTPPGDSRSEYNATELTADGTVRVKVKFDDAEEGAKVVITYGNETKTITVDAQNKESGVTLEVAPGSKVTAKLVDDAGNEGSTDEETIPNADVDAPTETPKITFEPAGDDNIYNKDEVGEDGTVKATITVEGMQAGDKLIVNGVERNVTPEGGKATVEIEVAPGQEVKAYIQDAAGNKGPEGNGKAPAADTEPPSAPTSIEFPSNVAPSTDGTLTRNEINKDNNVPVKIGLPTDVQSGDTVIVATEGSVDPIRQTITDADIKNKSVTVSVPVGVDEGTTGTLKVTASFEDKAGNTDSGATKEASIDVNRQVMGKPSIEYTGDEDRNGVLSGDEIKETTPVTLHLPNIAQTDAVTITLAGKTATVIFDNTSHKPTSLSYDEATYSIETGDDGGYKVADINVPVASDATQIDASITVVTGSGDTLKANQPITIDRNAPGGTDGNDDDSKGDDKPTLEIADADDDWISAAELKDPSTDDAKNGEGVLAKVTFPEGVEPGDVLVFKNDGTDLYTYTIPTGTDTAKDKSIFVTIPKENFQDGEEYSLTVSVREPYNSGSNPATPRESADSDSVDFTVDTSVPGDSNNDGTADTNSKPSVVVLDTQDDGKVGVDDLDDEGDDDGIQLEVTLPQNTQEGDTVVITLTKPDGTTQDFEFTTGSGEGEVPITGTAPNQKVPVTIPTEDLPKDGKGNVLDGTYKVTATVKDEAGNTSLPSDPKSFDVDTIIPGDTNGDGVVNSDDNTSTASNAPSITIPEAGDDTLINAAEFKDGVQVEVKLPTAGVEVGDKVVLTVTLPVGETLSNGSSSFTVESEALTKTQIDGGTVKVTIPNDANITVKDGSAAYSVTAVVKDAAGNTSATSNSADFKVDNQVPGDSNNDGLANSSDTNLGKPLVAIPENEEGDGVDAQEFNDGVGIQVTLPVKTTSDDTIVLTITPKDGGTPIEYKVKVSEAEGESNNVTVTVPKATFGTAPEGEYTVTAQIQDAAGNKSAVSDAAPLTILDLVIPGDTNGDGTVDNTDAYSVPSIAIAAREASGPEANDEGKITAAELNADNGVKVKVTLPSGVEPGDIIVIKNNGEDLFSYSIPERTNTARGQSIMVTVPKENVTDGAYNFTATVKEPAGTHETEPSNEVGFSVDATVPGDSNDDGKADGQDVNAGKPTVIIPEAENGVSEEELSDGVKVKVSLPEGTQVGDTVTLTVTTPGGNTFLVPSPAPGVTAADLANNSITVTIPNNKFTTTPPDGDYSVTAQITDSFGNTSAQSDSVPFTIDTTDPMAPEITSIRETGTDTLGGALVNAGELSDDGINVNVKLPEGAKDGDMVTVVITPNGKPAFTASTILDSDVKANGTVPVNVPQNLFPAGATADGNYSAIARVTDKAGNVGADSDEFTFEVDMTIPGDTNGDGKVDDSDNSSPASNAPSITIPEAIPDKLVNQTEFEGAGAEKVGAGVQVKVTLPTKGVEEGDKVVLTVTLPEGESLSNGSNSFTVESAPLTKTQIEGGTVTVTIPNDGNITVKDGSAAYSVTAVVKDDAGNTSAASSPAEFIVDIDNQGTLTLALAEGTDADQNPDTPMVISGADLTSDGGIKVTVGLPAGAAEKDVVNFLVYIPKADDGRPAQLQLKSEALQQTDLDNHSISFVIPANEIKAKRADVDSQTGENPYRVIAYMTDAAGNRTSSQTVQFTIDTKAPSNTDLRVEIPEATTPENDGLINPDELESDDGVKVEVTLPTGIQPGDKVNVTVTGPDGKTITLDPHEVAAGETAGGKVSFIIPADKLKQDGQPVDGDYTVTATVSDSVGNTSQGVPSSFTLDTTATKVTAVTFASDKLPADSILTNKEIGTDGTVPVHIALSEAIKAGDTIKIFTGENPEASVTYPVKPEDIGKTELDISVPVGVADKAKGTLAVKVQVVDKAGNASDLEATASHADIDVDRTHVNLTIEYTADTNKDDLLIGEEVSGSTTPVKITLPSSLAAGDTVKITINDGVTTYTVKENAEHQMTLVQSDAPNKALVIDNGAVTIHPDTTGLSSITTTVIITPANGGNTIPDAKTLKLDSSAPSGEVTIAVPEAANPSLVEDGKINAAELKDGVQVNVTLPGGVQAGDIIEIKDKEGGEVLASYTIQPTDLTKETIAVTIPSEKLSDDQYTVTATVKEPHADDIARSVNSSNEVTFTVDATAPGGGNGTGAAGDGDKPVIEVVDDSLTKTEFDNGVTVKVTLPEGTEVGDTVILKVTGGELSSEGITYDTYTVQAGDLPTEGDHVATITIPKASLLDVVDGAYTITAQVKDGFGNASPVSDPDNFTVDTMAPGGGDGSGAAIDGEKPTVAVTDDLLNKTEFDNGVTVKVTLPAGTQVGDTVILKVAGGDLSGEGITYTEYTVKDTDLPAEGEHVANITIPKASLPGVGDGEYTITAQVKDDAGQLSPVSDSDNFTVDTKLDDGLKAEGNPDDGSVTITIPAEATEVVVNIEEPANTVTLTKDDSGNWTSDKQDVVPAPTGDGPFTTTIPGDKVADGSTVKVDAEDKAGNQATATVTAPDINDAPVLTLTQEEDLSFTAGQATAGTKLARAEATDADGDKVTLTLENNESGYYRLDTATGHIYLTQAGADFVNNGNSLPDLQVKATDGSLEDFDTLNLPDTEARDSANAVTAVVDPETGAIVTGQTDPGSTVTVYNAKGELVGTATAGGDGSFSVTLTRTVSGQYPDQPDTTFKVDTDGNGVPDTDVTTDASGHYSYTVNNPIVTGETLTVKSVDPNNNLAETTAPTPDKLAPNPPVIAISDDGTTITGTAEPGSTIKLTVTDSNGTSKEVIPGTTSGVTIVQEEDGSFTVTFDDPLTDKETVTATAKDNATPTPNESAPSNEVTAPFINNTLEDISIALANDTGALPDDKITNDGSLKLSQPSQGAVITHVEYKGDDGQYHEIALGENGAYVLPEGVYEAGEIRVTQQDTEGKVKYSYNEDKFVVDTTPPAPATTDKDVSSGNVIITLPASADVGDTVQVFVGTTEVTLTRGQDGNWTSNNSLVTVPAGTKDGGKITISENENIPSGTGVSVQSFDVAGNTAAKDNDVVLDTGTLTVVFAHPAINSDTSNDLDDTIVLNRAELLSGGSASSVKYKIYLPEGAKPGDKLSIAYNGKTIMLPKSLTEAMINKEDNSFILSPLAGNQITYNQVGETNQITATFTKQGSSTPITGSLKFNTDIYTPDQPKITSKLGGAVEIALPNKADGSKIDLADGIQVKDGDKVLITAGNQTVELVREGGKWTKPQEADWLTISDDGLTATIPANLAKFPYGTTITAQAYDLAGNKSAIDTGHVVESPLSLDNLRIFNEDIIEDSGSDDYTKGLNTKDGTIRYEAVVTGQEEKDALIKVQLVDANSGIPIDKYTQYIDITADKTNYQGAFTGLVADGKAYRIEASIVNKSDLSATPLDSQSKAFTLDNVAPVITALEGTPDGNGVTVSATDGSNAIRVGDYGNYETLFDEKVINFGSVTENPQQTIVDAYGNKTVINNPKYDWLMRAADDRVAENPNATDHAPGWYNVDRKFYWNGSNTEGDTIIAAPIRTDGGDYNNAWKQGAIGTEDGLQGFTNGFELNTRGGGSDYIQSRAIVGYTRIYTNDGDDKIVTDFMHGTADTRYFGDFDGSEQIYMGSGNDSFTVQGSFHDVYAADDPNKTYTGDWAGMFATNAKIDMGDGNDTVTITEGIYADNQRESGNYFNLGAGDDTMTTGTISSKPGNWEGSNIINLGTGNDTLTVNGAIESYGDNIGNAARFVLYSEDSSTVTVTGRVSGRVSMLMGNGNDNISVHGNFGMSTDSNEMNWLPEVFNGADTRLYESYGYYGPSFYDGLRSKVEAAFARSNAVDDSTGGNLHLHDNNGTAARVDLGNGDNTFWVKGSTIGARIVGGQDADVIKLGTDPDNTSAGGINPNATVTNTLIGTSAGDDSVTLVRMQGGNYVNTGEGNDSVEIHGVQGLHNTVDTGAGDDRVTIYGTVATPGDTSNPNAFNLGAGYDVLSLGANGNTDTNNFSVGATVLPNYAQVLGVEEIAFNGKGATVRIDGDLGTTGVRETLLIHNTANGSGNKVDLNGSWTAAGTTTKVGADGMSYNVTEYHSNDTNDIIYIQNGIQII